MQILGKIYSKKKYINPDLEKKNEDALKINEDIQKKSEKILKKFEEQ